MNKIVKSIRPALLAALLLFALAPAVSAQGTLDRATTTGTISGALDGAELEWRTLELEGEDGLQNTANYDVMMDMIYNYTLQGHMEGAYTEGALAIAFSSFSGPLVDCPCEFTGEILHWTTSSMFRNVYADYEAVITVVAAELLEGGALRLVGTATGQLEFYESAMNPEPSGDAVSVSLEFEIERATLEEAPL